MNNLDFGKRLETARLWSGLTQRQLANATSLHQSDISQMEQGKRLPGFEQLLKLAGILKVSLQWFLTGSLRDTGTDLPDLVFQLQDLGIWDLHVENARVPGAFRHDEEVMALAVQGDAPSARIIEAMPAVIAWNVRDPLKLLMFASLNDDRVKYRLGWLTDIAITIHQGQGFPGGCPYLSGLEDYVRRVGLPDRDDLLGFASSHPLIDIHGCLVDQNPPVSKRWKMGYPASLNSFRERAEQLHVLRAAHYFRVSNRR